MRRQDALAVASCVAVVVVATVYMSGVSGPIYYPVEHVWRWQKAPGVPMLWYGRSLFALGAGTLAGSVAWALARRLGADRDAPDWLPKLLSAVTLAVLGLALGHTVLHEYSTWMR